MKDHENIFEYFFVRIKLMDFQENFMMKNCFKYPFILAMQTNSFILIESDFSS